MEQTSNTFLQANIFVFNTESILTPLENSRIVATSTYFKEGSAINCLHLARYFYY